MVGEQVFVKSMIGLQTPDKGKGMFDGREMFNCIFSQQDQRVPKRRFAHEMTMPLTSLGETYLKVLTKWFECQEMLRPVFEVFFGTYRVGRMHLETRLLHLSQVVESFHRRLVGGTYVTAEEFKPIRHAVTTAIPAGIPNDLRDKLKSQIKYGNEPSLRKRLNAVLAELTEDEQSLVCKEVGYFVSCVVDTRNYLTHLDKDDKADVLKDKELYGLTKALERLITIMFLKYVGIASELVVERLGSVRRFGEPFDGRPEARKDAVT
jgi:ApeA N-terminal domain 1